MGIKLEFIELNYQECADILIRFPSRVAMFYLNDGEIRQIKSDGDFATAVANEFKVYQQLKAR